MRLLLLGRFAIQDLCYDWKRSLLSLIKLGMMVTTYLLVVVLGQAFQAFSNGAVTSAHNLLIVSADILTPSDSSLTVELLDQAAAAVRSQFGELAVRSTAPVFFRYLNVDGIMVQVLAAPQDYFQSVFQLKLVGGAWPVEEGQIVASSGAAQNGDWKIGQRLEIYRQSYFLTGIIESTSRGAASLWMTFPGGELAFGSQHGIQLGVLQINPQANLPAIQSWLEATPLLGGKYAIYQESQLNGTFNKAMRGMQPLGYVFQILAMMVLIFGGFNVASLSLLERQSELVTLNQIGFSPRAVQALVLCRTAYLSLTAYLFGWFAAWLLLEPQRKGIVLYGAYLDLSLSIQTVWIGLVLALLCTSIGAWLASHQWGQVQ